MLETNFIQQGWECPKCKRVYSPTTIMCIACPQHTTSKTTSDTPIIGGFGTTSTTYSHNFVEDGGTTSKTKCKICGKEKWEHPTITFTNSNTLESKYHETSNPF